MPMAPGRQTTSLLENFDKVLPQFRDQWGVDLLDTKQ